MFPAAAGSGSFAGEPVSAAEGSREVGGAIQDAGPGDGGGGGAGGGGERLRCPP